MARLTGPNHADRLVYIDSGGNLRSATGKTAQYYADLAGTTAADVLTEAGVVVPVSGNAAVATVGANSLLPRLQYPPNDVDMIYVSVNGGPITPLPADADSQVDAVETRVGSLESGNPTLALWASAPSGGDDTAALQALLNQIPAAGGAIYLRAGNYSVPTGGLTCSNPVAIHGVGAGTYESGGTRLVCSSSTATLLTLASPGSVVSGVAFVNSSGTRPTAGAGLLCTDFDWGRVERCLFIGFWNNAQVDVGYFYSFAKCAFLRPVNYGLYMRNTASGQFDHGDQVVEGCNFSKYGDTTYGGTAVRWESGGGLRIIGSKVNAGTQPGYTSTDFWEYGFRTVMQSGATSVHTITGCSVEGFKVDGVKIEGASGSSFGKISIVGNELLSSGSTGSGYAFHLDGSLASTLNTPVITGNVAYGGCGGVKLNTVRQSVVTGNNFAQCTGDALNLTRVTNLIQGDNLFATQITDVDATDALIGSVVAGRVRGNPWKYAKEIYQLTSNSFYGKIKPGEFSAGILTVRVSANVSGVGGVRLEQRRSITRGSSAAAVVVAGTIGTDVAIGAASAELTITYDVAAESGYVKPKVTSVNARATTGVVEVIYEGSAHVVSYAD